MANYALVNKNRYEKYIDKSYMAYIKYVKIQLENIKTIEDFFNLIKKFVKNSSQEQQLDTILFEDLISLLNRFFNHLETLDIDIYRQFIYHTIQLFEFIIGEYEIDSEDENRELLYDFYLKNIIHTDKLSFQQKSEYLDNYPIDDLENRTNLIKDLIYYQENHIDKNVPPILLVNLFHNDQMAKILSEYHFDIYNDWTESYMDITKTIASYAQKYGQSFPNKK